MSDIATPVLVTIPNVEIAEVGEEWDISNRLLTLTPEHLAAAVEAVHNDPAVKAPRVRFGHTDEWPEASEPAFGVYENLRVENNGQTLVGDLCGVPEWFAAVMPAAYPNRSMDGWTDATTHTGHTHALLIEAISFLGVKLPGINTLEDLVGVWDKEPPAGTEVIAGTKIHATKRGGEPVPKPVTAAVGMDDLRKAFYDDFAQGPEYFWWWIRQTYIEPTMLIVDDDEGGLWAIEYTVSGDAVEFGEPKEVLTQYVYTDGGAVAAAAAQRQQGGQPAAVYANAADSRPRDRNKEEKVGDKATATTLTVERADLIKRLGLPDDADEDAITKALAEEPEQPDEENDNDSADDDESADDKDENDKDAEGGDEPEGDEAEASSKDKLTVPVDRKTWEDTQKRLTAHDKREADRESKRRDEVVSAAAGKGRIPRSRVKAYRTMFDADPEGTEKLLTASEADGGLPENTVPVSETGVQEGDDVAAASDDAQQQWYAGAFPELARSNGAKKE